MMNDNLIKFIKKYTKTIKHKIKQTKHISRKTLSFCFLLIGSIIVSLISLGFAKLSDYAVKINNLWFNKHPFYSLIIIPIGFMFLNWVIRTFLPYVTGSGIPQVIAALHTNDICEKRRLVKFSKTFFKIPLTFIALVIGASIGREGPSVQLGASAMLLWGVWCKKKGINYYNFSHNDLLAAGAASGLASAFNAPLSGVIFAIEELGKGILLKWDRQILISVLVSGFIVIAIEGNNPHFPIFKGNIMPFVYFWALVIGLICGVFGGLFSKFLVKGFQIFIIKRFKYIIINHPIIISGFLGLVVSLLGILFKGEIFGLGYNISEMALNGNAEFSIWLIIAKYFATLASYWSGLAGGIFTPSLSIGSGIGANLSCLFNLNQYMPIFSLLAMAGFLSGTTQAPITSSIVVMEMTASFQTILWLLITSLIAAVISRMFSPRSFYHESAIKFYNLIKLQTLKNRNK